MREPMFAVVLIAAQLLGPASGVRPPECGAQLKPNVWERVKSPELARYCELLASGSSKLASTSPQPEAARALADLADKRVPGKAAPSVLRGRAREKLAQYIESFSEFSAALAIDPAACDEPVALHAFSRAAAMSGHLAEAAKSYRALLPRATALPADERGAAYVEAGLLLMGGGKGAAGDAVAVLRQARRESHDSLAAVAALALALALDRADLGDEAEAVLRERREELRAALLEARTRVAIAVAPAEAAALAALSLEISSPVGAAAAWRAYADAGGVWSDHARSRAASLLAPKGRPR